MMILEIYFMGKVPKINVHALLSLKLSELKTEDGRSSSSDLTKFTNRKKAAILIHENTHTHTVHTNTTSIQSNRILVNNIH